jgi:diaminohydroxyphosphoribosylaminopyrimidine deaminase/5-amino-6-(5-phosphoribosylamino)uracil reductase
VLVRGDKVVGEAWHEEAGGPHAEVIALEQAGDRARASTAYVTMEPCTHHGRTPPCTDALVDAGVAAVLAGCRDPNPEAGGGLEKLRAAGLSVALADGELGFACRAQNEAWRTWVSLGRPFVILKLAVTLDGRVTVPGARWVSGEAARRRVHELRAQVDAVAVGMGTVRADEPQLTARDVDAGRQPRRIAFGRGPLPSGSGLELRTGTLDDELRALAGEGVQSLLLEGGPTISASFLRAGLVDRMFLFVAPKVAGSGPPFLPELDGAIDVKRLRAERVGGDLLVTAYVREP